MKIKGNSIELNLFSTMMRIDFVRDNIKFTIEYDFDELLLSLAYRKDGKLYIKEGSFDTVEKEIAKVIKKIEVKE